MTGDPGPEEARPHPVPLATIGLLWLRLGCIGFGGPPAHIALLRRMCVVERRWIPAGEFEDAIATTNLLPGPASTQLAIYCAWRLRGAPGAVLGGLCFILPGLTLILALAAVFLQPHPPAWIIGAATGAGAAVPAVAVSASSSLVPASWRRTGPGAAHVRWMTYAVLGGAAAALLGSYLVVVLVLCGATEIAVDRHRRNAPDARGIVPLIGLHVAVAAGGLGALVWEAAKVGTLSYGGGFVIIPILQHDAVTRYHWMTSLQFINAVALGQITPGPVVQTVAVVGYAAAGVGGALLASLVAFGPSFVFVLGGGPSFHRIRSNRDVNAFLTGAGPAVIGAIAGSAVPLGLALTHLWQIPVLAAALVWLLVIRRGGVVSGLLVAGAVGVVVALAGVR